MKTKNFGEFLNEETGWASDPLDGGQEIPGLNDEPIDSDDFRGSFSGQESEDDDDLDDNDAYDYDKILDIINSNSSEDAAEILSNFVQDICRYR